MIKAKPDLSVTVGDLKLKNPLILAAGPCSRVARGLIKYAESGFAAVVTKTITPEPWGGNPPPRDFVVNNRTLLLESSGIPNVGFKVMVQEVKKAKEVIKDDALVVVNITSEDPEQFAEMSSGFEKAGADAIELAIFGCPNYKPDTRISTCYWEKTPDRVHAVVKSVRNAIKIPIWVKFWDADFECIEAAEKAGANAVHKLGPANPKGLPIDVDTGEPLFGHPRGTGCVFGAFSKYPGLKLVTDLVRTVQIPVLGEPGVWEGKDVIEYTMAGATGIQLLTSVMIRGPKWVKHILDGIEEYMVERGYSSLNEIRGMTLKYLPPKP